MEVREFDDPVTVGTYVTEDFAEQAADHLRAQDFDDVQVVKIDDGVWQVRVPWPMAQRAVRALRPREQWAMQTHF